MIEYNYPECTTACLTALSTFSRLYPDYRAADVKWVSSYLHVVSDVTDIPCVFQTYYEQGHQVHLRVTTAGWKLVW